MEDLDLLYKELILDHHRDPRNFGSLPKPDRVEEGFNPLCGDRVRVCLQLDTEQKRITACRFQGEGCSICMASSSMMTEEVQGRTVDEARKTVEDFRALMQGENPVSFSGTDVESLQGVRRFPVRIKCALLGWTTLKHALEGSGHSGQVTRESVSAGDEVRI